MFGSTVVAGKKREEHRGSGSKQVNIFSSNRRYCSCGVLSCILVKSSTTKHHAFGTYMMGGQTTSISYDHNTTHTRVVLNQECCRIRPLCVP